MERAGIKGRLSPSLHHSRLCSQRPASVVACLELLTCTPPPFVAAMLADAPDGHNPDHGAGPKALWGGDGRRVN
jgi:hypothetical protein